MAIYMLRTFKDIQDAVMEQLKYQSSDTITRNRIKRNINVALDEIQSMARFTWARKTVTLYADAYYSMGTATATSGSVTVTLSSAPGVTKKGYWFAIDGYNEIYKIRDHVSGSTTVTLETPYTGTTGTAVTFKIWTDSIPLPTNAGEIIQVRHSFRDTPLQNLGLQEYRRVTETGPKAEGRPSYSTTSDFVDPTPYSNIGSLPASVSRTSAGLVKTILFASTVESLFDVGDRIYISGAGQYSYNVEAIVASVSGSTIVYTGVNPVDETAAADVGITVQAANTESYERYRNLLVYPALFNSRTTLHVDYVELVAPLENDLDEPPMPIKDRQSLFYGAMWLSLDREKDPEGSATYGGLFRDRVERMSAKSEDSPDKPVFAVSKNYLANKRYPTRTRDFGNGFSRFGDAGGNSSSTITGTANTVAVFDSSGALMPSTDVSTTELSYLDGAEALTAVTLADATTGGTAATWIVASFDSIHGMYSIKRGATRESGWFTISSDGATASTAFGGISSIGSTGVTFDADVTGGSVRLLYTTTSTGAAATMKYELIKWLS